MGRGKSKESLYLIDAAQGILESINPATVRAVCYRLFTAGIIRDMGKNETAKVSRQLTYAREEGIIPWAWIVDETREAERVTAWDSTAEIIEAAVTGYRRNNWKDQKHWLEVWSEKGTVRGTLAPVLDEYGVTFRVMHGYGSATAIHDVAEETRTADKDLTVFYVGDYDCSGLHMSECDLPDRIERYDGSIQITRIALLHADVAFGELPAFPAKRSDPRYDWYMRRYGDQCWELDALSPVTLRDRVEAAIVSMIDADIWNRALMIERAEVESMHQFANQWRESILRQDAKYSGPVS